MKSKYESKYFKNMFTFNKKYRFNTSLKFEIWICY